MNIYDQILGLCISKDELRSNLAFPCKRNGVVLATNGHVLVIIDEKLPEEKYDDSDKFPKKAEGIFYTALSEAGLNGECKSFNIAALESALAKHEKEPIYESKPCPNKNCNGGHVSCDCCGYDDTCCTCGGNGRVYTHKVVGQQFKYDAEVQIGEVFFKAFYANDVLAEIMRLTGSNAVLVAQQAYNKDGQLKHGSIFKIGNVDLMMMPVARTYDNIGALAKGAVVEFDKTA